MGSAPPSESTESSLPDCQLHLYSSFGCHGNGQTNHPRNSLSEGHQGSGFLLEGKTTKWERKRNERRWRKKYGKESFANEARGRHLQFIVMFLWLKCQVAIHQYLLSDLSFFRTIALVAAIPPLSPLYFPENLFNLSLLLGFSKSPNLKLATKQIY